MTKNVNVIQYIIRFPFNINITQYELRRDIATQKKANKEVHYNKGFQPVSVMYTIQEKKNGIQPLIIIFTRKF